MKNLFIAGKRQHNHSLQRETVWGLMKAVCIFKIEMQLSVFYSLSRSQHAWELFRMKPNT